MLPGHLSSPNVSMECATERVCADITYSHRERRNGVILVIMGRTVLLFLVPFSITGLYW